MADKTIGSLPAAASIEDDSRLVAEQQGEAVHFTGKQLKDYAKSGLDALVAQAQTATDAAEKAATEAEAAAKTAADKAAAVTADAEAAAQAAQTATEAQAAAQTAREAAENAKTAAEQAASAAAQAAAGEVKATLEDYVTQAEQAKTAAQSAAQTAADGAVAEATQQVAGYVAAAESAKEAAEKARDEAQAIVGGDFMYKNVYDPTGKATDIFAYIDEHAGGGGSELVKVTMPKGRMRGDVDGDGEITVVDTHLVSDIGDGLYTPDEVQRWCADVNADGAVDMLDLFASFDNTITMGDYYGNWTYADGCFYTDIAVADVTAGSYAIVAVQGDCKRNAFAGAQCFDGYIRVKANILPTTDRTCLVFYSPGEGDAVIVPENVVDRVGAPPKLQIASSTAYSTKIFDIKVDDNGTITATEVTT